MKRKSITLAGEKPTIERQRHSDILRETIELPGNAARTRYRVRPILTPYETRRTILDETAGMPGEIAIRSLRRRLTALDRALSNEDAAAFDRLGTAIADLTRIQSADLSNSRIQTSRKDRLPCGDRQRRDIAAMTFVLRSLTPLEAALAYRIAGQPHALTHTPSIALDTQFLNAAKELAGRVRELYGTWAIAKSGRNPT